MTTSLDDMIDRAPDGEIEVGRRRVQARLRRQLEDLFREPVRRRASAVRASLVDRGGAAAVRRRCIPTAPARSRSGRCARTARPTRSGRSQVGIWTYPNGHSYLGDYHDDSKLVAALKDPVFRDYIAALEKKKGKDEAKRILEVRRWNSNIYPNVSLMSQFQQLRVVHPIAVNRTVVHTYNFRSRARRSRCSATPSASPTSSTAPARWC